MKSLLILEHPQDFPRLKEQFKPGDLFIGLNLPAIYELEKNKVPFNIPKDYYNHDDFFSIYPECTSNLIDIITTLDSILWEVDERFAKFSLKPFFLNTYYFKGIVENIKVFIYILGRIIKQESPEQVIIVSKEESKDTKTSELFDEYDPVCWFIIKKLAKIYNFKPIRISPIRNNNIGVNKNPALYKTIGRCLRSVWQYNQKLLKQLVFYPRHFKNAKSRLGKKILCFYCDDLSILKDRLSQFDYIIEDFSKKSFSYTVKEGRYGPLEKLLGSINNNKSLNGFCEFESINFYDILKGKLVIFCKELEFFLDKYQWFLHFMKQGRYDLVVFQTLTYFFDSNILVDICCKENIPYICWIHGGFGANKTFEGYDMSDFLLGQNYFTYGDAINQAIENFYPNNSFGFENQKKLSTNYSLGSLNLYAAGAPVLEDQFRDYIRPNNFQKKIILILGDNWHYNQYYMGGNTSYTFLQKWEAMTAIVNTLIPFQKQYEIILKTYPDDSRESTLKDFLKSKDGSKIKIISGDISMVNLLKRCDLAILTWVSTSFFQAALTECDQFLLDDSDLTEDAKEVISQTCFFSDVIEEFCQMLSNYLKEGKFYQKSKEEFRKKFLNSINSKHRDKWIDILIKQCLNRNNVSDRYSYSKVLNK